MIISVYNCVYIYISCSGRFGQTLGSHGAPFSLEAIVFLEEPGVESSAEVKVFGSGWGTGNANLCHGPYMGSVCNALVPYYIPHMYHIIPYYMCFLMFSHWWGEFHGTYGNWWKDDRLWCFLIHFIDQFFGVWVPRRDWVSSNPRLNQSFKSRRLRREHKPRHWLFGFVVRLDRMDRISEVSRAKGE